MGIPVKMIDAEQSMIYNGIKGLDHDGVAG